MSQLFSNYHSTYAPPPRDYTELKDRVADIWESQTRTWNAVELEYGRKEVILRRHRTATGTTASFVQGERDAPQLDVLRLSCISWTEPDDYFLPLCEANLVFEFLHPNCRFKDIKTALEGKHEARISVDMSDSRTQALLPWIVSRNPCLWLDDVKTIDSLHLFRWREIQWVIPLHGLFSGLPGLKTCSTRDVSNCSQLRATHDSYHPPLSNPPVPAYRDIAFTQCPSDSIPTSTFMRHGGQPLKDKPIYLPPVRGISQFSNQIQQDLQLPSIFALNPPAQSTSSGKTSSQQELSPGAVAQLPRKDVFDKLFYKKWEEPMKSYGFRHIEARAIEEPGGVTLCCYESNQAAESQNIITAIWLNAHQTSYVGYRDAADLACLLIGTTMKQSELGERRRRARSVEAVLRSKKKNIIPLRVPRQTSDQFLCKRFVSLPKGLRACGDHSYILYPCSGLYGFLVAVLASLRRHQREASRD